MASVLYSNARAVSAEKGLIGKDRFVRAAESDYAGALKILSEVGFGGANVTAADADDLIDEERRKFSEFVRENSPDEKVKTFFIHRYDCKNAEAIIKEKYLKTDFSGVIKDLGAFSPSFMKEKIFSDDYTGFPAGLSRALDYADEEFTSGRATGGRINSLFNKALYEDLFSLGHKGTLAEILSFKADFSNLSVAIRTRDFIKAEKHFVSFGTLGAEDLKFVCEKDGEEIAERFKFAKAKELTDAAATALKEKETLKNFEKISDEIAVKVVKRNRFDVTGINPFVRYCVYKEADIINARIILVGLSAGLKSEEVAARLRDCYEG